MDETKVKELEARIEKLEESKWNFTIQERLITISIAVLTLLASCLLMSTIIAVVKVIVSRQ